MVAASTPAAARASSMRSRSDRPPTGSRHLLVRSVRGASRRAAPAARMIACIGRSFLLRLALARLDRLEGAGLPLLGLHLPDELVVRRGLDDLVELRPVVGHQAHALDADVIDQPPLA